MKELRSKRHPHFAPQLVSDEEFEEMKKKGLAKRFHVLELGNIRQMIPTPKLIKPVIEKSTKKKNND